MSKVIKIYREQLIFDDGLEVYSEHESDCCEHHWMDTENLELSDFDGLEFDLTKKETIELIDGFGIALHPIEGYPVRIPCYGSNNGYYSSDLTICVSDKNGTLFAHDATDCQEIND